MRGRLRDAALGAVAATILGCASAPAPEPPSAAPPAALSPAPPEPPDAGEAAMAATAAYAAAAAALGDVARGRYVEGNCAPAEIPDPAYDGFEVKRCAYRQGGLDAIVYVLNAPGETIARAIANACAGAGRGEDAACARALVRRMRLSNGFIFPVAGDVLEPASAAGPRCGARHGERTVHVYFRDGVTIETERGYTCETYAIAAADADAEAFRPPAATFDVGRIAALDRDDYARLMGVPRPGDDAWRAIVRDSYLAMLRTGRYSLLDLVARDPP